MFQHQLFTVRRRLYIAMRRNERMKIAARGEGKHPGSAGILACWISRNGRLVEASRQGCLRSQDVCLDLFDAVFWENRANCQWSPQHTSPNTDHYYSSMTPTNF